MDIELTLIYLLIKSKLTKNIKIAANLIRNNETFENKFT